MPVLEFTIGEYYKSVLHLFLAAMNWRTMLLMHCGDASIRNRTRTLKKNTIRDAGDVRAGEIRAETTSLAISAPCGDNPAMMRL